MRVRFTCLFILCINAVYGQLLSWSPDFVKESAASIDIICDASLGNQGLLNYASTGDVYIHLGIITSKSQNASDWQHVPAASVWGTTSAAIRCTYISASKWKFTITGGLRSFFGVTDPNEKIFKIALLFRNGDGSRKVTNADGADMYVPVYDEALYAQLVDPISKPDFTGSPETITKKTGDPLAIAARSSAAAQLTLYHNGAVVSTASASTSISGNSVITQPGLQTIVAEAVNGTAVHRDTITFNVPDMVTIAPLPTGVKDGINYETNTAAATLVLYAPGKSRVTLLGDFNNWQENATYQLNRTPDGQRFWLRLTGLTPGVEYAFQYLVDGTLKLADPYTEKVLDPGNDSYISAATYPGLKPYPVGKTTGIVSILQTAQPAMVWQAGSYQRPDKKNLVIYELLLRDFLDAHNWQTLQDTLGYLKRLGVNAIELMPVNEFEGNNSWGYNPDFYFAPDKYYGTAASFKKFIDACHANNIAVIMDIAMNHSFGQSPLVQMYWDAANNRPAADNPWFNAIAKHPFNVGYDFNHQSAATRDLVDRVVEHWLTNYKIDGFRWDLSKGFTQNNSCTTGNCDQQAEVNSWSAYDASRVAIWKRIYDKMQSVAAGSYCILEHFADNREESELSDYGMLLWGNSNYNFNEATMGYVPTSDFQYGISANRGWAKPHLITYQESHDEERLAFKNIQFGNSSAAGSGYDVKSPAVSLRRNQMAAAFWAMIPGPKMLWQFGELGYDFSINRCEDGSIKNDCRLSPKPIRWDYLADSNRQALYQVYSRLIRLKLFPSAASAFTGSDITWSTNAAVKWLKINGSSLRVMVVGNFDVVPQTASVTYPSAGTWYNYLSGGTVTATGQAQNLTLQPGEYYVYTSRNLRDSILGTVTAPPPAPVDSSASPDGFTVNVYPNPVSSPATIRYTLPENGQLSIVLTEITGRIVAVLFNGYKDKGIYTQSLPLLFSGKLQPGLYGMQVRFNGKKKTLKLLVTGR